MVIASYVMLHNNCNGVFVFRRYTCVIGDEFLELLKYSEIEPWFNVLALFIINVFFLLLAYINLRTLKKEK